MKTPRDIVKLRLRCIQRRGEGVPPRLRKRNRACTAPVHVGGDGTRLMSWVSRSSYSLGRLFVCVVEGCVGLVACIRQLIDLVAPATEILHGK